MLQKPQYLYYSQSELERHNLAVESQLKNVAGAGIISDKIEHIPVLGKLAPILRKLGLDRKSVV